MNWKHDDLQADLASCRRDCGEIVGEKVGLGMGAAGGQADVVAVRPSWSATKVTIYEVKISRADFLSDVRSEKWRKYLPCCERLSFAAPTGMIAKGEVPAECGLIVRGPNGWVARKAAPRRPLESPRRVLLAMLLKDHPAIWKQMDRGRRIDSASAAGARHRFRGIELSRKVCEAFDDAKRAHRDAASIRYAKRDLAWLIGESEEYADAVDLEELVARVKREVHRAALHKAITGAA